MGIDQGQARQQRATDRPKPSAKHPFFALEHRVMDSPAFADLSFSARALLDLIGRQLTRDNNGHLQATFAWCARYGFGSEHTLRAAIADLISHGFIYRTRSHGAKGAWARYAVTWLPITKREGLFLAGFAQFAYRKWEPIDRDRKKAPRRKCRNVPAESAVSPPNFQQKVQEVLRQKLPTMNHVAMVAARERPERCCAQSRRRRREPGCPPTSPTSITPASLAASASNYPEE